MSALTDHDREHLSRLVDHFEREFKWKQSTILRKINAKLGLRLEWNALWHDPKVMVDAIQYLEGLKQWIEKQERNKETQE